MNIEEQYNLLRSELDDLKIPLTQMDAEFMPLCQAFADLPETKGRPKTFVEIGTRHGGSLFMLAQFCMPGTRVISIDLPGHKWGHKGSETNKERVANILEMRGYDVELLELDSQQESTRNRLCQLLEGSPIDCLFIDGDHSYGGLLNDWRLYHGLVRPGGLIAFHDIINRGEAHKIKVHYIWRVLAATEQYYRAQEWVAPGSEMGIGALWVR